MHSRSENSIALGDGVTEGEAVRKVHSTNQTSDKESGT